MNNKEKQSYWHDIVGRFNSSELTQHKFCEQEGIKYRQFKYYFYKFKESSSSSQSTIKPSFTPVSLHPSKSRDDYQVILPNGVRCSITSGFNQSELMTLLGVLNRC